MVRDAGSNLEDRLIEHYKNYGAKLLFITDKSQEGFQFVKGFGGCGGFLRFSAGFLDEAAQGAQDDGDFDLEKDFI